jgi:hypothetical protein
MSEKASKYGFGGGIQLPKQEAAPPQSKQEAPDISKAIKAGNDLGFVSREPSTRRKPGPKRREPQDKVSIPGPKRIIDRYRAYCAERNLTLWQGLEDLLNNVERR